MRDDRAFWGIVLVLLGVLLLAATYGGLPAGKLIGPLLLMTVGAWVLLRALQGSKALEAEELEVPRPVAESVALKINHSFGHLRLRGETLPESVLRGSFRGGVQVETRQRGDAARVELRSPFRPLAFPSLFSSVGQGKDSGLCWDLALAEDLPIDLELETGLDRVSLDLSSLEIRSLKVESGLGEVMLRMPEQVAYMEAHVEGGLGSFEVQIPDGVAARIRSSGGLSSVNVDEERFPRQGDSYRSSDYGSAERRIDLEVEVGLGSLTIR